jgi:hypothetical protein
LWARASFLWWPAFDAARSAEIAARRARNAENNDVIGGFPQTRLRLWLPIAIT